MPTVHCDVFLCESLFEVPTNHTVRCDGCGVYLEIEEEYYKELQGQVVECPSCEREVGVPSLPKPAYEDQPEPEVAVMVKLKCHGCMGVIELTPEKFERMKGRLVRCPKCRRLVRVPMKPPTRKREFDQPPTRKAKTQKMVDAESKPFAKTMRLDDIIDGSTQARTLEEGVCLYCNSPLKQMDDHTFVCESCWRVIRTVKRKFR